MNMDFDRAEALHKEVYKATKNELELLIADIGLMKICQRTAMNKEYYDYRNSALRRMKRIREESDLFADRHETLRLDYAFTEFFYRFVYLLLLSSAAAGKRLTPSTRFRRMKH